MCSPFIDLSSMIQITQGIHPHLAWLFASPPPHQRKAKIKLVRKFTNQRKIWTTVQHMSFLKRDLFVPYFIIYLFFCVLNTVLNSWFSLTSYQNSEVLNNGFRFENVYGIVENLKLHIWANFWSARTFRLRVIGERVLDILVRNVWRANLGAPLRGTNMAAKTSKSLLHEKSHHKILHLLYVPLKLANKHLKCKNNFKLVQFCLFSRLF